MATLFSAPRTARAQTTGPETEAPPQANGATERARTLFASGEQHYERGNYPAAVEAFREAQQISGKPELLYNLAQAERLNGDCAGALEHYRAFRAAGLESPADLDEKIADMERCVATTPPLIAPQASGPAPAASTASLEDPPNPDVDNKTSTTNIIGWACLGGAALSATLGTVLALRADAASGKLDEVNRRGGRWSASHESYEGALVRDRTIAIGLFVGAGVLAGTGGWLLLSPPTGPDGDGLAAQARWSF